MSRWKFIGQDKSMGFRHGRVYRLNVEEHGDRSLHVQTIGLSPWRILWCPYSSWEAFRRNWQPVEQEG